jgi:hypothetical protein
MLYIHKYITDLRHVKKLYLYKTNTYLPIIQPFGELSSINDYLSSALLESIAIFIDITSTYHSLLSCSKCYMTNSRKRPYFPRIRLTWVDSCRTNEYATTTPRPNEGILIAINPLVFDKKATGKYFIII